MFQILKKFFLTDVDILISFEKCLLHKIFY